jgi:DNA repair/transcription protein MET18/MMS19
MLWAQKYCNLMLPQLIEHAQSQASLCPITTMLVLVLIILLDPSQQTAYLVALASLIKAVPKATYADQMPKAYTLHLSVYLIHGLLRS